MASLTQIARRLSPRGWAMLGGSALAAIAFLVIIAQMASAPSYATLQTGLDPAQTGKITSALSTQGIPYQLQNNGTALAVESDKTAQARVALATAGLLSNQQPGFTLMDKQALGQSNFQQQITYERALEGQLDSTIQTIDGVSSAQVNLVLPNAQDQLFADSQQPATASVLLSGSSSIDPGAVRGIAQLVASSVPGLQPAKVTITGSDGSLLWPTSGTSSNLPAKQAAEQRYDSTLSSELNAMLAQTVGAGKAQVVVNANLDANQSTSDSLQYAKKGVPLTQQTTREALKGGGSTGSGGAAGVTGNVPAYAQGAGGANSNYRNQVTNTTYGVNKTVTHTVIAPGAVQSQSVSVLVSSAVPAASIPAIRNAVSSAAGIVPKRDTITVSQLPFAPVKPVAATPAGAVSPTMSYARDGAIALGSLAFLIFAVRLLRKRERESLREPTWLRELQSPRPLAALERREMMAEAQPTQVMPLQSPVNVARRQVEDLAERDPERVAQHLRAWMAED